MSTDKVVPIRPRPTPEHVSTGEFASALWDFAVANMRADAALVQAETAFFGARRRRMVYDRIPVGHDTGYRCFDGSKHDSESAFTSGEFGDGMTQDEAYCAWLREIDEPEVPATSAEREMDEAIDDGIDFDSGLTDDDAR